MPETMETAQRLSDHLITLRDSKCPSDSGYTLTLAAGFIVGLASRCEAAEAKSQAADHDREPVAARHAFDGHGWLYIDSGSGCDWMERAKTYPDCEWLYDAPEPAPQSWSDVCREKNGGMKCDDEQPCADCLSKARPASARLDRLEQALNAIEILTATGDGLDPDETIQIHIIASVGRHDCRCEENVATPPDIAAAAAIHKED